MTTENIKTLITLLGFISEWIIRTKLTPSCPEIH